MDILGLIKDKLTDSSIEKVSNFLGEHPENISLALNNAVPTVLEGIIQNTTTEDGAGKVMDVLKDGGHTGEILDDLPGLLGSFDKTQLLITIGSNIFAHFLGNKSNGLIETIASLSNIRKTSASSLVGLATPLVLGAIGKVVAKEGLGVSGLMKLLNEQQESVLAALPPALVNKLNAKSDEPIKKTMQEENKERKKERAKANANTTGNSALVWIPWVLLGLVLLAILAYWWKSNRPSAYEKAQVVGIIDSTSTVGDTAFVTLPTDSASMDFEDDPSIQKIEPKTPEVKVEEKKPELPKIEAKPTIPVSDNTSANTAASSGASVSEDLKSSNAWIGLPNLNFKKGSAEISGSGDINDLVKFLKNNAKAKIMIAGGSQSSGSTLGEDRAYALREALLEKGVKESQLEVQAKTVKDIDAKITVKVIKK